MLLKQFENEQETKQNAVIVCWSSATIRDTFLLMLVATSTWLCGLMAVNNSILAFYYIFDILCLLQVWTKHFVFI